MKVLKFGGTSLGSHKAISNALSILLNRINKEEKIIVVVSAFSGITDQLIALSDSNQSKRSQEILQSIKSRHVEIINHFFNKTEQQSVLQQFYDLYNELIRALQLISQNREEPNKNQDYISGFGERFSAQIITSLLESNNINALYTDTRNLIKTNDDFGFAKVEKKISYQNISDYYQKNSDSIIVATGFIASTIDGIPTTLGRGGSDYTASLFAAAISAEALEIWTDVDGLMTADPDKVNSAVTLDHISYKNAEGFSKYGAKVIYPPTIVPAMKYDIPIYIKNTFKPELNGTLIHNKPIDSSNTIFGISSIQNVNLITVRPDNIEYLSEILPNLLCKEDLEAKILECKTDEKTVKIVFSTPNISESLLIIERAIQDLFGKQMPNYEISKNLSMITLIGNLADKSEAKNLITEINSIYDGAVKSTIYSEELETISIFTENTDENRIVNHLHELFITKEMTVNT